MAEYIDRDAAIEWLEANKRVYDRECKILIADQDSIVEWLKRRPAADVAPVIHAHWIYADGGCYCSKCESERPTQANDLKISKNEARYCYFCGAKMDEETSNV